MEIPGGKRSHQTSEASGSLKEPGWRLMSKMGFSEGQGLGREAQGRTEPVSISTQKDRRGFGLTALVQSDVMIDPKLVWCEGHTLDHLSDDRIWRWSKFDEQLRGNDETETKELSQILLSPNDERALGQAICDIEQESNYCSSHLLTQLTMYKNKLDSLSEINVRESHQRSNPYESLKNGIFMNRAAMKLANMDALFNGIFTNVVAKNTILYFADVCAGPGGFSEYVLWRRCNGLTLSSSSPAHVTDIQSSPIVQDHHQILNVKGYGLTLKNDCDFREFDFFAGPAEAFMAHYGSQGDGDITKWENLASFSSLIGRDTKGHGVHILCADGGFDVSGKNNLQEVLSKQIYLCQCLCALIVLRPGGHFVTKLFDTFTEFSVDLIYLMGQVFEEIYIVKPVTSRPANSERYLLCKSLLSPASVMAGCPEAPARKTCENSNNIPEARTFKPSKSILRKSNCPIPTIVNHHETNYSPLSSDKTGPVGDLIQHFLRVNDALVSCRQTEAQIGSLLQTDILRLCVPETVSKNPSFRDFIVKTNEELAEFQCVALSKLITFANDHSLNDPRQSDLVEKCLRKWQLGTQKRERIPWPLSPSRPSGIIQSLISDGCRMRQLSDDYIPSKRTTSCGTYDFSELKSLADAYIGLVCAPSSNKISDPMMVYSRGHQDLLYTTDGGQWKPMHENNLKPRLPAATLVWGQSAREYSKLNTRQYSFQVLDVVCIYGYDCRDLPYMTRMELVQRMADVVNFPGMAATYIRVPPMIHVRELQSFTTSLQDLLCKDSDKPVPMHFYADGHFFQPHSLLMVKYLSDPWISALSRTTGNVYYFNRNTGDSTFSLQSTHPPTFVQTRFLRISWDQNDKINVFELIKWINSHSTGMSH